MLIKEFNEKIQLYCFKQITYKRSRKKIFGKKTNVFIVIVVIVEISSIGATRTNQQVPY